MFIVPLLLLIGVSNAYSLSTVNSFLTGYNVTNSTLSSLMPVNVSYSGSSYVILYQGITPYFIVNVSSSSYAIVLNSSTIFNLIKATTITNSIKAANFSNLHAMILNYKNSSAGPLNDCLAETGSDRGLTCTASNYCQSCELVPSCNKVLYGTNGPTGTFGLGITSFQIEYNILNNSFTGALELTKSINASSASSSLSSLNTYINNVSTISGTIYQNPIFPPLANVSSADLGACSSYLGLGQTTLSQNASAPGAPWYCNAIGYCQFLSYNYTLLHVIQARVAQIGNLPITTVQIQALASNTSQIETTYILPALTRTRTAQLNSVLNTTTLVNYATVVNNTQLLLSHIDDSTLAARLTALQSAYKNMTSTYITANLSTTSAKVIAQMSNLKTTYNLINATYSVFVGKAQNSTSLLLKAQLNTRSSSSNLPNVAYAQLGNNNAVAGQISNTIAVSRQLNASFAAAQSVYSGSVPLLSLTEMARGIDSPFVYALAPSLSPTYSGAVALVPLIAVLSSLIVGIVVIIIVYGFKFSLGSKRKLLVNQKTKRAWRNVFLIIIILIIIDIAGNYFYASSANLFAPATAFVSAIHSASSVAIAINGTATPSETFCQNTLSQQLSAMGKKPVLVLISNSECTVGSATKSLSACMSSYAQAGTPMIILTSSTTSSLSIYSFYGTTLNAQGNDNFMRSCYPALLLK